MGGAGLCVCTCIKVATKAKGKGTCPEHRHSLCRFANAVFLIHPPTPPYTHHCQVGLSDKLGCLASELSGGQRRKLSVAIAFLGDPAVVFLDEVGGWVCGSGEWRRVGTRVALLKVQRQRRLSLVHLSLPDTCDLPFVVVGVDVVSHVSPRQAWTPTAGGPHGTSSAAGG